MKKRAFDPGTFLPIGVGRKIVAVSKRQAIFTQGDVADAVFYIQEGKVSLTVVSTTGKEATIGILGEKDFFGEGSLAGQSVRMGSATALTACQLQRIEKRAMMDALHREHTFSDMFVVSKISQETLAEMVGTTRSRVSFFMNRFRKLGFIHYNGGLLVHRSLLNVVLHD